MLGSKDGVLLGIYGYGYYYYKCYRYSDIHGSIGDYDLYQTICSLQPSGLKIYFQIISKREKVYVVLVIYFLSFTYYLKIDFKTARL